MSTGGWGGAGTPILNFELTPHHNNFNRFTVGDTSIKISNWNDKIIKIAKNCQNFIKRKKLPKKYLPPS